MHKSEVKVVAHLYGGKLVKGFLEAAPGADIESALRHESGRVCPEIRLYLHTTSKPIKVELDAIKALFFVKSFEGSPDYNEVKFFHSNPTVEGLWVQIKFADGEVTEGVLSNSIRYIVDPGFFLKPPDPLSNNELVYVQKRSLADFRVLGVRSKY